ncbi:hypothetical protein ACF0H5_006975 [Mactra antiquata]
MDSFRTKSVKHLQEFLKERGVVFSDTRKADLVELCTLALEVNVEVDPDGLVEDREEVWSEKISIGNNNFLMNPYLISGSADISALPTISIFDIYNYLVSFDNFNHASLREYYKMEGYCMFKDGYVLSIQSVSYDLKDYTAIKAEVKPRTNDKDPVTKLGFYRCWILLKKTLEVCIQSAYCTCKGGLDGCCRNVVAVLFEVMDYSQDFEKTSCTSQQCVWIRRACEAQRLSKKPIPATDLDTSVLSTSR